MTIYLVRQSTSGNILSSFEDEKSAAQFRDDLDSEHSEELHLVVQPLLVYSTVDEAHIARVREKITPREWKALRDASLSSRYLEM